MSKLVDYDNEVFTSWAFYSVILLCKMMLKGIWTTKKRFDKQVNHLNAIAILCCDTSNRPQRFSACNKYSKYLPE